MTRTKLNPHQSHFAWPLMLLGLTALALSCSSGEVAAGLEPPPTSPILAIAVSPSSATVELDGTLAFSASAVHDDGSTSTPAVWWSATGGSITPSGTYTPGPAAGSYSVSATLAGGALSGSAEVNVVAVSSPIVSLEVTPGSTEVLWGESQVFTVSAKRENGTTFVPSVSWTATGGTITADGVFIAGSAAGTFEVIVVLEGGSMADTATVSVAAPGEEPYRHRPSSFTNASEIDFSQSVPTYSDPQNSHAIVGAAGWYTTYDSDGSGGSNFSRIADLTAPQSPSDVWQLHWAPGTWSTSHGAGNIWYRLPNPTKLYVSMRFKLDPNYAWQRVSNKFLLLSGGLIVQVQTQGRYMEAENGAANQYMRPGLENGATMLTYVNRPVSFGEWHQYEMVIDLTAGTWKQWVDGILVLDAIGLKFTVSTFDLFDMTGHRGGGGETLTRDMYWYLDHFYLAWP